MRRIELDIFYFRKRVGTLTLCNYSKFMDCYDIFYYTKDIFQKSAIWINVDSVDEKFHLYMKLDNVGEI